MNGAIALLIQFCVMGSDNCEMTVIAQGFVAEKQCEAYSTLMVKGWEKVNEEKYEVRRFVCTMNANYIINAFKA